MVLLKISGNLAQMLLGALIKTINRKGWLREAVPPLFVEGKNQ